MLDLIPGVRPGMPIAVTMGEPAGIGGEILVAAWRQRRAADPVFFALDDPERLRSVAATIGINAPVTVITDPAEAEAVLYTALPVLPLSERVPCRPGQPDPQQGPAVLESIARAVALTLEGRVTAIVTNPIQKARVYGQSWS